VAYKVDSAVVTTLGGCLISIGAPDAHEIVGDDAEADPV
jgi:hypothetical protein